MTGEAIDQGPRHWRLRMRDLCERTGLPRQAIHFYIQQGLLPPGRKTGRNMAFYGEAHVERLELVRKLQHERFLPLKAIKALLDDRDAGEFSETQRRFLRGVRAHLPEGYQTPADSRGDTVSVDDLVARLGASRRDVARLHEAGVIGGRIDDAGALRVAAGDAWIVELVAQMRAAGFTEALGFDVDDLSIYEAAIGQLLRWEAQLLSSRLAELPPEKAAAMVDRAVPLMESFLVRTHAARLRQFLENL